MGHPRNWLPIRSARLYVHGSILWRLTIVTLPRRGYPDAVSRSSAASRSAGVEDATAALALAEPRGMRPVVAHCHLGLGKIYRRAGTRKRASEHLTNAATMYREMGMRFWLEQVKAEMR